MYKDRNATQNTWREIFVEELHPNVDDLNDKNKNVFVSGSLYQHTVSCLYKTESYTNLKPIQNNRIEIK